MFIGGDSHDHLTGSTAGNTPKAILSGRHRPRLGPHCSDLCPHVFRRSAQRSDPELVSGTQIGGYSASGNEISNTDLLSCSRSSAVPRTSAVRATGNWRVSPPGSPFFCCLRRFPCVGTRRMRWSSHPTASRHGDNRCCGQAICPSRARRARRRSASWHPSPYRPPFGGGRCAGRLFAPKGKGCGARLRWSDVC